jgi:hypothetical protein
MKIIGLTGKARAGKDTAAGFILEWCEERGLNAERLAFADPLKVSAARALGFNGTTADCVAFCNDLKRPGIELHLHGPNGSDLGPSRINQKLITGREFLQLYGTEAHRDVFGQDFWVEVTERKLAERAGTDLDVVVLTDCRFPNEATMVNKHDGEVWEIDRPDNTTLTDGLEAHSSEVGLPDGAIEFCIANVGDEADLRAMVRSVCETNLRTEA